MKSRGKKAKKTPTPQEKTPRNQREMESQDEEKSVDGSVDDSESNEEDDDEET